MSEEESVVVLNLNEVSEPLEAIQIVAEEIKTALDRPALTTSFSEYTVTESLLLLLFLSAFVSACIRIVKEGFSWL